MQKFNLHELNNGLFRLYTIKEIVTGHLVAYRQQHSDFLSFLQ